MPLLTPEERRQQLVEWNAIEAEYPQDRCIHELFEEQVERTPDAVAVVFEDQRLTYRELNARANQLAHYLQKLGVGPEALVGLCLDRSLDMVVGLLGILKAGGAYVPMDPSYPTERLAFIAEDAQVKVLLTQQPLLRKQPKTPAKVVCIDNDWNTVAKENPENLLSVKSPKNLAYIIYTSGSTGKPKGVMVEDRQVTRLFAATEAWFHFSTEDVWTLFHSLAFDFSVWELWGALFHGGRLVIVTYLTSRSPDEFYALLCQEGVTILNQTPSAFYQLQQVQDRSNLTTLRLRKIVFGGEKLEPVRLLPWLEKRGDAQPQLVNMYGITETTVHVTYHPLTMADAEARSSPIGKALPDLRLFVLDRDLNPVPIGIAGEVYVAGAGLGRGYLNRPALTAERFVPNPFSDKPGARFYRSGDLARYLPDGNIEYLWRMDDQVKLRGYRIELGEIEAVLGQHPGIQDCVVIAREDIPSDKKLVAYFVSTLTEHVGPRELRSYLKEKLPEYMVPAVYIALDTLPLTPNGKVDRRSLPAPDLTHAEAEREYEVPRTPIEELLAGIWTDVLGIERVSIHDNFFELGGHSLLAIRIVTKIRQVMHIEIPVRVLFESPTIAAQANQINILIQKRVSNKDPSIPIPRFEGTKNPPLSFTQQRLWFLDQMEPGNIAYNEPVAYRLFGPLNVTALESSFSEIIRRHESLRTSFRTVNGQPVQIIAKTMSLPLQVVDLKDVPEPEREIECFSRAIKIAKQPFNLTRLPLLKMTLFRMAEEHHILLLVMHHIVIDQWSIDVFFKELSSQYHAFLSGRPILLSELPIQYADYAVWQRKWLQDENRVRQLSYWKQQLANLSFLELSTDRPRPAMQTYRGANRSFSISQELTDELKKLSRRDKSTLFMTLLASFKVLLHRYTSQEDIAISSPIANRNRAELEDLIGFFLNMLILRTDFTGQPSFREILGRVRRVCLDAYSYQDLPFEMIVDELNIKRELSRNPLFQVMFVLENAASGPLKLAGLSVKQLFIDNDTAKFDLTLFIEEEEGALRGRFEYNTDLFDAATIDRMIGHYKTLVEGIVANPDAPISRLPLLTDSERNQLLVEWNATEAEYPQDRCIHPLFEEQVERTPHGTAVVSKDQTLTYRELNERSNQLAHYLRRLGVKSEERVGVCLVRSLDLIVSLLGVLKAGGAYLPLDPKDPHKRLAYMLRDAGATVLLTQAGLPAGLADMGIKTVCIDTDWETIAKEDRGNPDLVTTADSLIYVMYTSGSTGSPKGTEIRHRSVARLLFGVDYVELGPGTKLLQLAPVSFDASTFEIWGALLHGGRLILAPDGMPDLKELDELIRREGVTTVWLTASLFNHVVDHRPELLSSLRQVLTGGEALSVKHVRAAQEYLSEECRLVNGYGPTEGTTFTCCYEIPRNIGAEAISIPIGRPIANTRVYILDPYLRPVPIGVPGDLHVGGPGLARGYLNRPDLTAEKFIPDPFGNNQESRLYKTGDLARYLPDGNIEFLGRMDQQVKLRGYRIELGEIEAVLRQHPGVQECVLMAREDIPGNKQLVAYFVSKLTERVGPSELRSYLKEKLPEYMVPAMYVELEAFPLTPNGKVDRRSLPAPNLANQEAERKYVAPRTPIEELLAGIWADLLRIERVSIHDNFFELGGHSLLATQLISRVFRTFQVDLSVRTLFEAATIAELAQVIDRKQIGEEKARGQKMEPLNRAAYRIKRTSLDLPKE